MLLIGCGKRIGRGNQLGGEGIRGLRCLFLRMFGCCGRGLISAGRTGRWALPKADLEIFLLLFSFLSFKNSYLF